MVIVVAVPGVVAMVDVPVIAPPESEVVPDTKTSPAPPPPPRLPNPPPPPPPMTATSIAFTPVGVVQLQVVTAVNVTSVYPPEDVLVGEQAENEGVPLVIEDSVPIPSEFTARIRIL
jgi:hypothetical protein